MHERDNEAGFYLVRLDLGDLFLGLSGLLELSLNLVGGLALHQGLRLGQEVAEQQLKRPSVTIKLGSNNLQFFKQQELL